ncbi:MAG TPA: UDP-N-acetylmuramoyl-L-alanyl-D-glutamate--2,6-diaminopimelate ligase [Stellaceae bacterium]|nr:UDP-N-acetylmuramoyl-L-alanyl-D-glutamate--2,6-diaminopimelate ligase [Stellaceae bacterium]
MDGSLAPSISASYGDPNIRGLTADSRAVEPGFLFAALPGTKLHGKVFVGDAVKRGAVALLTDDAQALTALHREYPGVLVVVDSNPRRRLARMAARFHAPQPKTLVAVTGTNGKTSVAAFTRQIWERTGRRAASVGTLGVVGSDFERPGALTTPDPVTLHRELQDLARRAVDHVAIEASSHGLDQFRLDGLEISAAAFTNLSRDHLDYHPSMEAYLAAKARLFGELMPRGSVAVLNADAPEFDQLAQLCRARSHRIYAYGTAARTELRVLAARLAVAGQELDLKVFGRQYTVSLPLVGRFQAMNALAALGLALATGAARDQAVEALSGLAGAPGRVQHVATHPNGAPIFVDYAHTPDALENVLTALRPHCRRNLMVVFGAGGDRDSGKRPVMGEVTTRLADVVIVTDDNPRSEDPAAIRRAILVAAPGAIEIGDRGDAIAFALEKLQPEDLLVIAGKGHEQGQIVGGVIHPFDDAEVARAAIARIGKARR